MEHDHKNRNNGFLRGLYCGVLLSLLCVLASVGYLRWRTERTGRAGNLAAADTDEPADELDLNSKAVQEKIAQIEKLINQNFLGDVDAQEVEEHIYSGMLDGLSDPYCVYYSKPALQRQDELTNGVYTGIGAVLNQDMDTGTVTVAACFPDTPAAEAALAPGDIITAINGKEIAGLELDEVVSEIKAREDKTIRLNLIRGEEKLELTMEKRDIEVPTVEWEMLEDKTGYLQILEFDAITYEQVKAALAALEKQGMEKLIVDLRNNPGGVLDTVCAVADLFLPERPIVYVEDKQGRRTEYPSDAEHCFEKPLVVLVNENSASASEIFAGAMQDYKIGTLLGTATFGKGIVQRVYELSDGSGVKLTIAKYYTPNGNDIHEKGIKPDVEVPLAEELRGLPEIEKEQDNQLQEAIRILRETPLK